MSTWRESLAIHLRPRLLAVLFMGFGSGVVVPSAAISLQNRGFGFTLAEGHPNRVAPRKRPAHTLNPVMVMKDGKLRFILGTPGGGRIITTVLQTILNVVDFNMNIQEAVDAPRVHNPWMPDVTKVEPYLLERVEVLKVPSSVLYGQASPGGVLNLVSKRASPETVREVQLQYGSNAFIAPAARLDDGRLDLTAIWPLYLTSFLTFAANMTLNLYIAPIVRVGTGVTGAGVAFFQSMIGFGAAALIGTSLIARPGVPSGATSEPLTVTRIASGRPRLIIGPLAFCGTS